MAKKRSSSTPDNSGNPAASFTNEVILWAVLAVSIILFISNFGIAGAVGNFISSIFFGLFGLTAYIFPILLFAGTAFIIANQENKKAVRKAAAAGVLFVFVCMFLELISGSADTKSPLDSYVWSSGSKSGGGLLGGLLTWLIQPHLGTVSAYVIDIIMMIICIVLVTQRSLWKPIQSGSRKMYASAKKETIRQRQQYNERRQRRVDNKVTGVSTDTSLKNASAPGASDNVSEIRPDPALLQDFPIYMMNQPMPKQKEASVRQTIPQQEEKPQLQQGLAAAGMGYGEVLPFHENIRPTAPKKADSDMEVFDKIIPITNRKVALQPNVGQPDEGSQAAQAPSELGSAADMASSASTEQTDEPDDFLLKTGDLFSELLPGGTDTGLSADEPQQPFGALDTGQTDDNALWDFAGEALAGLGGEAAVLSDHEEIPTGEALDDARGISMDPDQISTIEEPQAASLASVWDEEPEPEEMLELPPVSAEELIAQQLQAAAPAPKRVTAVAPVTEDPAAQPAAGGLSKPSNAAASGSASIRRQPKQSAAQAAGGVADVQMQMMQAPPKVKREYILPPVDLLKASNPSQTGDSREHLQETALKLQQTLKNFGVNVAILNVSCGPSVTRYEIQPEMGVKVSKIVNLADDIKLNLAAADIRIEAPIPGKAAIGIEVPNKETVPVMFRDLIESDAFGRQNSSCAFAAGKDISGQAVVTDICKMPHLLIAGATGSGKSVCINTIIMSILYKANPDDVKLIMIDPKVVELSVYNGIPHLLLPVVTDPKKAAGALHWAVSEMMDRYQKFADYGVRDMKGYNAKVKKIADIPEENKPQKMPYIVIIVDELADLMMAAPGDVEDAICRLAQLARAAGIHLIIATQRPSVNVITGLIKANMPSRIAFSVTSGIDSRTILDMNGAEKLLGKGDMLFYPQGFQKPVRVQGAFVSDAEVSAVVEFLTNRNGTMEYNSTIEKQVADAAAGSGASAQDAGPGDDRDVYFADAAKLLMDKEKASVSMLQRYFKIGFNRAARIMDQLEEAGVVGPEEGTKPRKILMSPEQFAQYEEEVL